MVSVGLETSVIIRVGSVTSTCLRSNFGDMRGLSARMSRVSSGAFPGQSSMTNGPAARALEARVNEPNKAAAEGSVFMAKFLYHDVRVRFNSEWILDCCNYCLHRSRAPKRCWPPSAVRSLH